ncbi:IclR family transcriptional regulator [Streptomyces sp. NPDC088847]|uniref:IclR family transcriptional regulator n=1 Tax=Streptomyces sp. NPDC088847 TaxID=3365909 RepID=UPI0038151DF7
MTTSATGQARDDRAAIDKAISLLVAFGDRASIGLGVSELARRAGLSKSTTYRVLSALERNGLVEREGTDYRLGEQLHRLGRAVYAPDTENVRDLLQPYLSDLYEMTRQTVHLAVLHGIDVVYLAKLYGHRAIPVPSRIGGRLPAHASAVGKLLLAYDADAAARAVAGPLQRFTDRTITDPEMLADELRRIRRAGIAYDRQESRPGLNCVAAPVLTPGGTVLAALSVSVPGSRDVVGLRRLSADVRRVAAAASQGCGRSLQLRTQRARRSS